MRRISLSVLVFSVSVLSACAMPMHPVLISPAAGDIESAQAKVLRQLGNADHAAFRYDRVVAFEKGASRERAVCGQVHTPQMAGGDDGYFGYFVDLKREKVEIASPTTPASASFIRVCLGHEITPTSGAFGVVALWP